MNDEELLDRMRKRAHGVHVRAAIRRWKYRQRNLAAGVWFRIRRVLAEAREAYVLTEADARALIAEGYAAESSGVELNPQKTIIFVESNRLSRMASARSIPVNLGPEFLAASAIALVPFDRSHVMPGSSPVNVTELPDGGKIPTRRDAHEQP